MFERFTDRARRVLLLAQEEAKGLGHDSIGTEHLLLGLAAEGEGVAYVVLDTLEAPADAIRRRLASSEEGQERRADPAAALAAVGIDLEQVRREVEAIFGEGALQLARALPFTPLAKKTLEMASHQAVALGHNYIGTEHLLLAVAELTDGLAPVILAGLGVDRTELRETTLGVVRWAGELAAEPAYAELASLERAIPTLPEPFRVHARRIMSEVVYPARAQAILRVSRLGETGSPQAIAAAVATVGSAVEEAKGQLAGAGMSAFLDRVRSPLVVAARTALDRQLMNLGGLITVTNVPSFSAELLGSATRTLRAAETRREELWDRLWESGGDLPEDELVLGLLGMIAQAAQAALSVLGGVTRELSSMELPAAPLASSA
ncbi:MAG TPA: Clp protease N-terminal domain-containing protein [Acidimicrobiales bacterium]|nr:Clp protease N-terminal domain-containing protein [Acidimicrobiales bacterium]